MDRGKKPNTSLVARNNKIYMDLKDIIREHALPFLPAKSLFRFCGVCRDWKLQISTPFFAHNQSLSTRSTLGFFCQTPGLQPSFFSIDPNSCGVPDPSLKFLPVPVNVLASSNGLLCCQGVVDKAYYICNPVTKQYKKLPKPNADHGPDPAIVLIFEPSLLDFVADYKLVCAFPSNDFDDAIEFEVYSSKEGCWKISGEICFTQKKVILTSGVHVDGIVYWQGGQHGTVFAFDLTKDRSQLIQSCYYGSNSGCLGVADKKLCRAYPNGRSVTVNVLSNIHSNTMQMGSQASTWIQKFRIDLDSVVLGDTAAKRMTVVCVDSPLVLVQNGRRLYFYNLKTKETKDLCEAPEDNTTRCLSYVNSLVYL